MAVDSDIDAITPVEGTPLDPPPKRLTMFKKLDAWCDKLNDSVAKSFVGKRFRLEGSGHRYERKGSKFLTEVRAGLTTFFAMAYIISVNSTILSDTGGTCVCNNPNDPTCETDTEYALCQNIVRRDLITATAAISALATFAIGVFANMPLGMGPGMGLNAYFAYNVVGHHGTGSVSYRMALTAVFVEGWVFFGLSLIGLRQWLARAIPKSIKLASGVGIGLYLSLIGLTYSAGIGAITGSQSQPLELAGCLQSQIGDDGTCPSSTRMRNPTMWLGIFCGGILTCLLMLYRVKGAMMFGILLVSIISWPRSTPVTYFPHTPEGDDNFNFFKKVVTFHKIEKLLTQQEWNIGGASSQFGLAFITFLYVDILDTTGTLYAMARFCGAVDERTQDFEGSAVAYLVDAVCISIGSLIGVSPITAFVESGAGISEGGRTGLTAVVTGLCFFISVFFAPIFASIPPWATGSTLVIVGSMMTKVAADINWNYVGDAVPAFITLAVMPFTYSIAYGLIAGLLSYICINMLVWFIEVGSFGKLVPYNKHEKDPWTYKIPGGIIPQWMRRLAHGKKDFWREDVLDANGDVISNSSVPSTPPNEIDLQKAAQSNDFAMKMPHNESPSNEKP
ncbi:Xanthine/uracil/vitamin C permease [Ascosphaera apis ARSEF 7405]|uniref:Xanthine/uracil/vitamin C permease n=1 Tax=Ascosphaera apis ARSEF 7405 TaxID=392613 RepID=A0A166NH97_9EURO|nr:Xanthine/uracil/vitamin C permease [Ascosphaera apis ARSEF 7405]